MGKSNFKIFLFFIITITTIFLGIHLFSLKSFSKKFSNPMCDNPHFCPQLASQKTITPLKNTKHFLVSAFMDQRVKDFDIRIIGMFHRESIQPLYCLFWCIGHLSETTPTEILPNSDNFGFPFSATDVMCQIPKNCEASHVTLLTQPGKVNVSDLSWIPIKNRKTIEKEDERVNLTVCISNMFGDYNNVLQFAQTMEMYRLLGVNRVVIYNTSSGPDIDFVMQSYTQEGFLEVVPWPIDKHMNPSSGWLFSEHGGDIHYFGQLATLNECIYRSMERSRYVLLNDIDEIIMPYQHDNLMSMIDTLQKQHPDVGSAFLIENRIFPIKHFDPSGRFHLPQWRGVPGINILEHIYKEEPEKNIDYPHKIIVQTRMVEQTSVHKLLKYFGNYYIVSSEICHLIHVRESKRESLTVDQLSVDKRLWDFQEKLISNVDKVLGKLGFLMLDD